MSRQIPEKLINFSVYRDGKEWLGTASVDLPSIAAMTETISGAGIAGEVDSPTLGHYGSMTCTLNWRTLARPGVNLFQTKSHALTFRGAQQMYDTSSGEYRSAGFTVAVKAIPKTGALGSLTPGTATNSTNEFELTYLKIDIDGRNVLEIDKFNFKCVIDGEDQLADVRQQLGM